MSQTDQRPPLAANYDGSRRSAYPAGDMSENSEGSDFTIEGSFGTNSVINAFSDPLIEATAIDATPANANGIVFNATAGYPFLVKNDAQRGKILYNTQDDANYNSALRYLTSEVPENTWLYFGHWTKVYLGLSGSAYTGYNQLKNDRWNSLNDINDASGCQVKLHGEVQNNPGGETTTLLLNEGDPDWSLGNQYGGLDYPLTDNQWFFLDSAIFTGTQGGNDARIIRRILRGGVATIIENVTGCRVYNDAQRFTAFIAQAYMGNWGPTIGTANTGPAADVRQVSRSSLTVIEGKKRIDLSTSLNTATAAWRHNIPWSGWNGSINSKRYYKGLSSGTHTIYARVIDGYTTEGWDNVIGHASWVVTK